MSLLFCSSYTQMHLYFFSSCFRFKSWAEGKKNFHSNAMVGCCLLVLFIVDFLEIEKCFKETNQHQEHKKQISRNHSEPKHEEIAGPLDTQGNKASCEGSTKSTPGREIFQQPCHTRVNKSILHSVSLWQLSTNKTCYHHLYRITYMTHSTLNYVNVSVFQDRTVHSFTTQNYGSHIK